MGEGGGVVRSSQRDALQRLGGAGGFMKNLTSERDLIIVGVKEILITVTVSANDRIDAIRFDVGRIVRNDMQISQVFESQHPNGCGLLDPVKEEELD
jgi:hypothetical protein